MHFLAGGIQNHRPKLAFTHFSQTFQQNAPCLKLIREMPLFWNSIFYKSSFKCKTRFLEHRVIANVDLEIFLFFLELEFHVKYSSSTWIFSRNSSTSHGTRVQFFFFKIYIYNFQFTIIQLSKNRVLNWNLIFRKSSFKTRVFP